MPSPTSIFIFTVLLSLLSPSLAHENGMDMSMDGAMSLASGNMLMYFHFTPGDTLWFQGWVPESAGAMVGTCIGLFLLGVVERWLAACKGVMEMHWQVRAEILRADRMNARGLPTSEKTRPGLKQASSSLASSTATSTSTTTRQRVMDAVMMRDVPPFILAHDAVRGILFAGQAALHFALMLAVMTFQIAFLLSIVIGQGIGEMLFGRFASHGHASHLA